MPIFLSDCLTTQSSCLMSLRPCLILFSILGGRKWVSWLRYLMLLSFHWVQFCFSTFESWLIDPIVLLLIEWMIWLSDRLRSGWSANLCPSRKTSFASAEIFSGLIPIGWLYWWRGAGVFGFLLLDRFFDRCFDLDESGCSFVAVSGDLLPFPNYYFC